MPDMAVIRAVRVEDVIEPQAFRTKTDPVSSNRCCR